jgi:hypothetical protein
MEEIWKEQKTLDRDRPSHGRSYQGQLSQVRILKHLHADDFGQNPAKRGVWL